MALFKIYGGSEEELGNVNLHEGYAYFCEDSGHFFIDTSTERKGLVGAVSVVETTLYAFSWDENKSQVVEVTGLKSGSNGSIAIAPGATADERAAARDALLVITAQVDGSLTIACDDTIPKINLPIVVTIVG